MTKSPRKAACETAILCALASMALLTTLTAPCIGGPGGSREGDAWLGLNQDTRFGFAWGYINGVSSGFAEGCVAYSRIVPAHNVPLRSDPLGKCFNTKGRGFSKSVDFYVGKITELYSAFPEDRDVPIGEVLKKLSDSENMTPQEIHLWYEQHSHGANASGR